MTTSDRHPGDKLIEQLNAMFEKIRTTSFPELTAEEVTDDHETYTALRCPRCGSLVAPDDLYAVDFAERWTSADELDTDAALDNRLVTFSFDDSGEFESTVYYRHDDHAVRLPYGWRETTR